MLVSCGCCAVGTLLTRAPLGVEQAAGTRDEQGDKGAAVADPAGNAFSRS